MFHMAWAQCCTTSTCAGKAGSAFPVFEPSAMMSAISSSCPPSPLFGAAAALAALLWARSMDGATPVPANPCMRAARPPVLTILAVSTPAFRSVLNLGCRCTNFFNRDFMTFVLRATPAASPTPRLFTLSSLPRPCRLSFCFRSSVSVGCEVDITDFVCDTSMPSSCILRITWSAKPPICWTTLSLSPLAFSADRSSTKRVGTTDLYFSRALSTGSIMTSRISEVARPDPATMPLIAKMRSDMAIPTRTTRGSRYVAIASRRSRSG